jgi:redox-sensitive bicupin YhaK (pirin superfamily)
VTYVVEGRIDHSDNQGHEGTILPGDVQWMTAGRGLIHNEIPAEGVTVHSLQLWVNLPAADKMTGPRYQDLCRDAVPVGRQPGVVVRASDNRAVVTLLLCLRIARHSSTPLSRACRSKP